MALVQLSPSGTLSTAEVSAKAGTVLTSLSARGVASATAGFAVAAAPAIQRSFQEQIAAGTAQTIGEYYCTEGSVAFEIQISSRTSAASGTTIYRYQGGYEQLSNTAGPFGQNIGTTLPTTTSVTPTFIRLMPASTGRGHGNGPDTGLGITSAQPWNVYLWNGGNVSGNAVYRTGIAISIPTGKAAKNLIVTITELSRGMTFNDASTVAPITTWNIATIPRVYSHRSLIVQDAIYIGETMDESNATVASAYQTDNRVMTRKATINQIWQNAPIGLPWGETVGTATYSSGSSASGMWFYQNLANAAPNATYRVCSIDPNYLSPLARPGAAPSPRTSLMTQQKFSVLLEDTSSRQGSNTQTRFIIGSNSINQIALSTNAVNSGGFAVTWNNINNTASISINNGSASDSTVQTSIDFPLQASPSYNNRWLIVWDGFTLYLYQSKAGGNFALIGSFTHSAALGTLMGDYWSLANVCTNTTSFAVTYKLLGASYAPFAWKP